MVISKILLFLFLVAFMIETSRHDRHLRSELEYLFGPYDKKNPSKKANVFLILLILIGIFMTVYYMPILGVGISVGSVIGVLIASISCVIRTQINN